ncbi:hypothetical protein A3Q56_06403 [Intoshia linei]|uniref:Fructose-1,6-bisphosphatase 1 n=1 Tax=Intoshia linei TaxID=1819745 RepID=A0A177AUW7_9BILA|nr:hypothetical protein A3Q56_06403 [Intoshia linei]
MSKRVPVTFTMHLLSEQTKFPEAKGELTNLMNAIMTSIKAIQAKVRRAGFINLYGHTDNTNVQGEIVKPLDIISNDIMIEMLSASYATCALISEENEKVILIDKAKHGKYIVCFDPLDGSSNIDCLASIGTIFAIYKRKTPSSQDISLEKDIYQSGRELVVSGYALYGSACMVVVALNKKVNGFMLDPAIGEFILTDTDIKIKPKGKIYSLNEGYYSRWSDGLKKYIEKKKNQEKPYSSRYIGSMVADIHRTLIYGGIFVYPAMKNQENGKLRLFYECNPIAHIITAAGGKATNGKIDILDIKPTEIHMRTPFYVGSTEDVEEILTYL